MSLSHNHDRIVSPPTWQSALRLSPQDVDPLSWLVSPWVGLAFAGAELLYGVTNTLAIWSELQSPWLEIGAVVLLFLACLLVQIAARPLRRGFGPVSVLLPFTIAAAAILLSAFGNADRHTSIEHWWILIGIGILISNCGPYSSALELASYGLFFVLLTCTVVWFTFQTDGFWTPLGTLLITATVVIVAAASGAIFSFSVVRMTQAEIHSTRFSQSADATQQAARLAELSAIARLASRVAPFLSNVAEAGEVTEVDRTNAGQLARRLRTDLVMQANRSWLDTLAVSMRLYVVDPDHRANNMNAAQRAAIRGLLSELQKDPAIDVGSVFIEFRGQADGSTAVALSLDLNLPEGSRSLLIAPYYLALKTTVRDISWDPVRELVRFRLPAKGDH